MSAFTEEWLVGPEQTKFYTRTYRPIETKVVLVFVHGFVEHIARYEHVFPAYAEAGIAVFAFDQRGHGRTALGDDPATSKGDYGKTSSEQQRAEIHWAITHAGETLGSWAKGNSSIPVFLVGHSMGGALVLSFGCAAPKPLPYPLAGIVSTSPLVAQTHPVNKLTRKAGGFASVLVPNVTVKTDINPDYLSHDKKVGEAYLNDPYVKFFASFKAISTMLNLGDYLSTEGYKTWPKDLPVLAIHGTSDEVTSHAATERFCKSLQINDKTFSSYEGGFHELHNEPEYKQRLSEEIIAWILKHTTSSVRASQPEARL
ncbi:hypothetical protein M422DRAFT_58823 [Sphaerobolus stellatus SS14]|nr:hypothetical protein M422DRAFT_58823 [Sphaerobolus stellatus SS14]